MINHVTDNEFARTYLLNSRLAPGYMAPPAAGFHLPLVQSLIARCKTGVSGSAYVFTSTEAKEGVSVVTGAVAKELAATSGEKVLIAMSSAIGNFVPSPVPELVEPVIREGNGVFRLSPPRSANSATRVERFELLRQLTTLFPFVLIDAPAISVSTEALEFGARSQGIVLVSAAGKVRRNRLVQAKRMIDAAGVPLIGCALNRRTYPIPDFIYKRL